MAMTGAEDWQIQFANTADDSEDDCNEEPTLTAEELEEIGIANLPDEVLFPDEVL